MYRSRNVVRMAVVVAVAIVAFRMVSVAGATVVHHQLFELGEIPTEAHGEQIAFPGPLGKMESMAVDSGHLWVAEGSPSQPSRVDEFDAETGAFVGQPIHLPATPRAERERLPTCYGEGCGEGIAVGHGFGEAEVYVGGMLHGVSVVSVFDEAGALKATWNGANVPGGTFGIDREKRENGGSIYEFTVGTVTAVAVDNNSVGSLDPGAGNVYVAVSSLKQGEEIHAIDVFHPEANGEERYVGQIAGVSASGSFRYIKDMAVEPGGDLLVDDTRQINGINGTVRSSLDVFEPVVTPGGYVFVHEMTGPPPSDMFGRVEALATDASTGEISVADFSPEGYRIEQFSAAGAYLGHVDNIPDPFAITVDPATDYLYARQAVYGPGIVLPDVATDPPTSLKPESAVLNGAVNPDNAGNVSCQFGWGTTPALENTAPCPAEVGNGDNPEDVQVPLNGLERGVTYYYRLEASNKNGTNPGERWQTRSFTTTGAIIREVSASDVNADSATLLATINPANQPTSYYFEYGTSSKYSGQVPATAEPIGSGSADVEVSGQRVQGLSPGTEYHYRLVVLSEANTGPETVYGPDRTFTTEAPTVSSALPDGRAWELVTPAEKHGALFFAQNFGQLLNSAMPFVAESSIDGNAMIDLASAPTEAQPHGNGAEVSVLSVRGSEGWSSKVMAPPHRGGTGPSLNLGSEYKFFSEDLSQGVVEPFGPFLALSPEANEPTPYLHSNFLNNNVNQPCESSCYRPLVTSANTDGAAFGEEVEPGVGCFYICGPGFVDATPDASYVALNTRVQLTSVPYLVEPREGSYYYEWSDGRLQPLFLLPAGEGGMGVSAGGVDSAKHQLADNGSVFFAYDGHLYLHDFAHETSVRLDVAQGVNEPTGGDASFLYASSDGSRVLFSDSKQLTSAEGGGIYECRIVGNGGATGCELTLTPLTGGELIGAAKDASYLYFSGPGQKLVVGHYEQGTWTNTIGPRIGSFIRGQQLGANASPSPLTEVATESSPDGRYLTFMSSQELAGYDNRDANSGKPDVEVYLYDAVTNKLVCASCNPTGGRPVGVPLTALDLVAGSLNLEIPGKGSTSEKVWAAADLPPWTIVEPSHVGRYQPRFLSDDGRLFFNADDAIVPQDVNGQQDVYEYEPPGVGDCAASTTTYSARSGGCVRLVSAGSSAEESAFMDASEGGGDVFFITLSKLTAQDFDSALDVYDAHECTIAVPCPPVAPASPPPCKTGDSCKAAPTPQPSIFGEPSSATFSGSGNASVGGTTAPAKVKSRSSGAGKLERALRACRKKHGERRLACERKTRRRYGNGGASHKAQVRQGKRG